MLVPLGFAFFVFGLGLSFIPPYSFTGYVSYSREGVYYFPYGIVFTLLGGLFLFMGTREEEKRQTLDKKLESIMISNRALEKSRKGFFKLRFKEYMAEIDRIAQNPSARPKEGVGEFFVSPRGGKQIRVAWHVEGDVLYIDDFLYHDTGRGYSDNWDRKAFTGKIRREDYKDEGYTTR